MLEVMIALGILAVGLVVLLEAHVLSLKMTGNSRLKTNAILLAEKKIAELESRKERTRGERSGSFGALYPEFSWRELVSPVVVGDRTLTGLSRAQVIVSWKEGSEEESVGLVTYVLEYTTIGD